MTSASKKATYAVVIILIVILFVPILGSIFFNGCVINNDNPYIKGEVDSTWTVNNMTIDIDCHNDRSFVIREDYAITYNTTNKKGFIRDLPTNSGERIRDIKVTGDDYEVKRENLNLMSIWVYTDNVYKLADKIYNYTIEYTLLTPKAKSGKDVIAINPIGHGWSTEIKKADINIKLPTDYVASSEGNGAEFYYGEFGNTDNPTKLNIGGDKRTITISATNIAPYNGVTAYFNMPDGTMRTFMPFDLFIMIGIVLAVLVAVTVIYFKFGVDKKLTPIVNFTAPNGLNPAEIGKLINNNCSTEDITSLIFYWASHGHLSIADIEGNPSFTKINDLDAEHTDYEKDMFAGLFSTGDTRTSESLKNVFYPEIDKVRSSVDTKYAGKLFNKTSTIMSYVCLFLAVLVAGLGSLLPNLRISFVYLSFWGFVMFFPYVILFGLTTMFIFNEQKLSTQKRKLFGSLLLLVAIIIGLVASLIFATGGGLDIWESFVIYIPTTFVALLSPLVFARSDFYNTNLNEIVGFRNFIELAEKSQLELMLADDPQYYYKVLPYAQVLGVSNIWQDKFANIAIEPPSWYCGSQTLFSYMFINSMYRNTFSKVSSSAYTKPSQSSSSGGGSFGSSGGGGFSGGGFGGGGGRSI